MYKVFQVFVFVYWVNIPLFISWIITESRRLKIATRVTKGYADPDSGYHGYHNTIKYFTQKSGSITALSIATKTIQ